MKQTTALDGFRPVAKALGWVETEGAAEEADGEGRRQPEGQVDLVAVPPGTGLGYRDRLHEADDRDHDRADHQAGKAQRDGAGAEADQQQERDHDQYIDPANVLTGEDNQQDCGHIDGYIVAITDYAFFARLYSIWVNRLCQRIPTNLWINFPGMQFVSFNDLSVVWFACCEGHIIEQLHLVTTL